MGAGVNEIERPPDGVIWFGSENGGVFRRYQNEWTPYYDGVVDSTYSVIFEFQVLAIDLLFSVVYVAGHSFRV